MSAAPVPSATEASSPCCLCWTERGCHELRAARCPRAHLPYAAAVVQHLRCSGPVRWDALPVYSRSFQPLLCLSSPPCADAPAQYLVALPIPAVDPFQGVLIGAGGRQFAAIGRLCSLEAPAALALYSLPKAVAPMVGDCVFLKGRGSAWQVDALIECGLYTVGRVGLPRVCNDGQDGHDLLRALHEHMQGWQERRRGTLDAFHSLQSRGWSGPAPVLPELCPHQLTGDCHHSCCSLSHAAYRLSFARLVDRSPRSWSSLSQHTIGSVFRAVLDCQKHRTVVLLSLPIQLVHLLEEGTDRCLFTAIERFSRADRLSMGSEGEGEDDRERPRWTYLRARSAYVEDVDTVLESVFFLSESAREWREGEVSEQQREELLERHIRDFWQRRRAGGVDQRDEFLSLKPPPPPVPSPMMPPRTAAHLQPVTFPAQPQHSVASPAQLHPIVSLRPTHVPTPEGQMGDAPPCRHHWIPEGCPWKQRPGRCPLGHLSYPAAVLQRLDRTPVAWEAVPGKAASFQPVLCVEPSSASSHPPHLVVLPIPPLKPFIGPLMGVRSALYSCIRRLCGLHAATCLWFTIDGASANEWLTLKGRGQAWQVDALLESVFFVAQHLRTATWTTEEAVALLTGHIAAFLQKRGKESQDFHSLRPWQQAVASSSAPPMALSPCRVPSLTAESRHHSPACLASTQSPASSFSSPSSGPPSVESALSPPSSASPASPVVGPSRQPCMAHMDTGRCPLSSACPCSHLPYVDLFVSLCDTDPRPALSIPSMSATFHPILARMPSVSSSAVPRYVVSFSLPRLPFVRTKLLGLGNQILRCLRHVCGLGDLQWPLFDLLRLRPGDPPVDWLQLTGEGDHEQVDCLLEAVLFVLEEGPHVKDTGELMDRLQERLQDFAAQLTGGDGGGKGERGCDGFLALSSRGAPALPSSLTSHLSPSPPGIVSPEPSKGQVGQSEGGKLQPPGQAMDLSSWHSAGETVTTTSALLVSDASPSSVPYFRCLPHTTFACLPIEWDAEVRDCFTYDVLEGQLQLSEVEATWQVDVFTPRVGASEATHAGAERQSGQKWLNVTVWRKHEQGDVGGEERQRVEAAVRTLVERYEAAILQLKGDSAAAAAMVRLTAVHPSSGTSAKRPYADFHTDWYMEAAADMSGAESQKKSKVYHSGE